MLKDLHQKHVNLKDKQIEQLLDGFQKQMQLIDVLRRQKVCIFMISDALIRYFQQVQILNLRIFKEYLLLFFFQLAN